MNGTLPPVALLAGGLATRLGPLTKRFPKSMVEVAGEPFIAHQLRLLRRRGIDRIVICAGHLSSPLQDLVSDGRGFGLRVDWSLDGDRLLGTGGALTKAAPMLGEVCIVMYGDSYLDVDYRPIYSAFVRSGLDALMTVYCNDGKFDQSNVVVHGERIIRYSKKQHTPDMQWIDWGLGIVRLDALVDWASTDSFDLADFYSALAERQALAAYLVNTRFYEVGSLAGIAETDEHLSRMKAAEADVARSAKSSP